MKKIISVLFVVIVMASILSCKKAGTGGNSTLVVYLKHHSLVIPNHIGSPDTVFLKFNAKDLPGTTAADFDTYFVGEDGEDHVHCEELKPGNYYLYGAGFDTTISQRVTGGIPITIKHSDKDSEIDIDLPVTE